MIMDREEIKKFLRHREPMLLVDEMELQNGGSECIGKYHVKGDEADTELMEASRFEVEDTEQLSFDFRTEE